MNAEALARVLGAVGAVSAYVASVRARSLVTVLCLHRVSPEPNPFFPPIPPQLFRDLCRYLKQRYQLVSFRELRESRRPSGRPSLVLSFDDGYRDFIEHAVPILHAEGLPANQNVIVRCADTGRPYVWQACLDFLAAEDGRSPAAGLEALGIPGALWQGSPAALGAALARWFMDRPPEEVERLERRLEEIRAEAAFAESPMLRWDEIRELDRLGIEIGSHSMTHAALDRVAPQALAWELGESKRRLEQELGHAVDVLAFPGGRHDAAVREAGRQAGYRDLLAVGDQLNDGSDGPWGRVLIYAVTPWRLRLQATGLEATLRRVIGR